MTLRNTNTGKFQAFLTTQLNPIYGSIEMLMQLFETKLRIVIDESHRAQIALLKALETHYQEELQPDYAISFFQPNKDRHRKKIELAREIKALCHTPINNLTDANHFVSKFNKIKTEHQRIDPSASTSRFGIILKAGEIHTTIAADTSYEYQRSMKSFLDEMQLFFNTLLLQTKERAFINSKYPKNPETLMTDDHYITTAANTHLERTIIHAFDRLASLYAAEMKSIEAIKYIQQQVEHDPLQESSLRSLLRNQILDYDLSETLSNVLDNTISSSINGKGDTIKLLHSHIKLCLTKASEEASQVHSIISSDQYRECRDIAYKRLINTCSPTVVQDTSSKEHDEMTLSELIDVLPIDAVRELLTGLQSKKYEASAKDMLIKIRKQIENSQLTTHHFFRESSHADEDELELNALAIQLASLPCLRQNLALMTQDMPSEKATRHAAVYLILKSFIDQLKLHEKFQFFEFHTREALNIHGNLQGEAHSAKLQWLKHCHEGFNGSLDRKEKLYSATDILLQLQQQEDEELEDLIAEEQGKRRKKHTRHHNTQSSYVDFRDPFNTNDLVRALQLVLDDLQYTDDLSRLPGSLKRCLEEHIEYLMRHEGTLCKDSNNREYPGAAYFLKTWIGSGLKHLFANLLESIQTIDDCLKNNTTPDDAFLAAVLDTARELFPAPTESKELASETSERRSTPPSRK